MTATFSAVVRSMRAEYMANKWHKIATWQPKCAASIPYPLFKLKDILATCAEPMSMPPKESAVGADLWC